MSYRCVPIADTEGAKVEEQAQSKYYAFEVWRLDDNGNEFLVDTFHNRESAEKRIAELAAGGNKQMYWVKEVTV